jgi:hypothetical protein
MIFGDPVVDLSDPANVGSVAVAVTRHAHTGCRRSTSNVGDQR